MPYFQVGQKLNEPEPRITSKILTRRTMQPQMANVSSTYLNQKNAVAVQLAIEVKPKARTFLQQSNQNVNVVANQNNFIKYVVYAACFIISNVPVCKQNVMVHVSYTLANNDDSDYPQKEIKQTSGKIISNKEDVMKENKPMTEGSSLPSQQKQSAKQHYLSISRYVVGRSTNIAKK